jgi:peptidoglycan hydrolase-like protein with peptidoglycan-binding domain
MGHSTGRKGLAFTAPALVLVLLLLFVVAVAVVGCGSSTTGSTSPAPTVTATVTSSPAASPAATSDAGEPSATVMALQSSLKKAGYYKGKLTGVYDTATEDAVMRLEDSLKVKGADGKYDAKTYTAQKSGGVQSLTTAFVQQIQVALQQLGFYSGNVDGVYGPRTVAAVKAFQSSSGLKADGIAGPKTIAAYESQIKGDSTVATLQQQLRNWGYYSGNIDGVYGPGTVQAVKDLQTDLGVTPVDGKWGPKTQAAVIAAHKNSSKGTATTMQIQSDLATLGFYAGNIDGVYGPQTTAAVKAFQKANGLPVDGIVGPDTLTAIQMQMKALNGG